jgi:hypothetical protein
MGSSDFLGSRGLPYLAIATILGSVSPMIAALFDFADPASRQGLLYWWFMGIPVEVDILLAPARDYRYLLWTGVFTLQYLAVFAAGAVLVLLVQRRGSARRPVTPPPEQERAFEEAAALYHLGDSA